MSLERRVEVKGLLAKTVQAGMDQATLVQCLNSLIDQLCAGPPEALAKMEHQAFSEGAMDHIIVFAAQWAAIVTTDASQGGSPSHFRAPPQRYGVEELDVVRFAGKLNVLYMCVRVWQMYDNEKEAFFLFSPFPERLAEGEAAAPALFIVSCNSC